MRAAQVQQRADKAVAAVSVVIATTRPSGPSSAKNSSIRSSSCTAFASSTSGIGLIAPDLGYELTVSQAGTIRIAARLRRGNSSVQRAAARFPQRYATVRTRGNPAAATAHHVQALAPAATPPQHLRRFKFA